MKRAAETNLVRQNFRLVKKLYPDLAQGDLLRLRELTQAHLLSVSQGEISCIDGKWYVTHAGLLRIALRARCFGIRTFLQERQSDPVAGRWVFRATVFKSPPFEGVLSATVMPIPRTRLPWFVAPRCASPRRGPSTELLERPTESAFAVSKNSARSPLHKCLSPHRIPTANPDQMVRAIGQPRLRDQLCLLIRQHDLDPTLVKAYAADFCGTATLKDASRDLVESFITQLATAAKKDRDALICKLNSYAQPVEAKP